MNPETTPIHPDQSEYADRRVYFEHLTALLLAQGFSGDRVGDVIAELDSHLEMTHTDPVDEFGPVGELADTLVASGAKPRPLRYLGVNVAFALSLGTLTAAASAVVGNVPGDGTVTFRASMIVTIAAIGVGVWALSAKGGRTRTGDRTFSLPPLRWMAAYFVFVIGASLLAAGLDGEIPTTVAWVTGAVAAVASAVTLRLALRSQRVAVPGNARHLRNLGWGWMGR